MVFSDKPREPSFPLKLLQSCQGVKLTWVVAWLTFCHVDNAWFRAILSYRGCGKSENEAPSGDNSKMPMDPILVVGTIRSDRKNFRR